MWVCKKISIITILVFFLLSSSVFALAEIFTQGDEFIIDGKDHAENEKDTMDTSKLKSRV